MLSSWQEGGSGSSLCCHVCAPKGNLHCAARLKERIYNWVANLPDVASVSCAGEEVCGNGIQGTSVCLVQLLCVI